MIMVKDFALPKSVRKYVREEKSRIHKLASSPEEHKKLVGELYTRVRSAHESKKKDA